MSKTIMVFGLSSITKYARHYSFAYGGNMGCTVDDAIKALARGTGYSISEIEQLRAVAFKEEGSADYAWHFDVKTSVLKRLGFIDRLEEIEHEHDEWWIDVLTNNVLKEIEHCSTEQKAVILGRAMGKIVAGG